MLIMDCTVLLIILLLLIIITIIITIYRDLLFLSKYMVVFLLQPLEVKLANQESDLVFLLKRLLLGPLELAVIRDKAEKMRSGTLKSRGEALLPLMLASFLFDALVIAGKSTLHAFLYYRSKFTQK